MLPPLVGTVVAQSPSKFAFRFRDLLGIRQLPEDIRNIQGLDSQVDRKLSAISGALHVHDLNELVRESTKCPAGTQKPAFL